jgi:hypothetical protein
VVVKFHGRGFILGTTTDDCGWGTTKVVQTDPIVTRVDAWLALDHPFLIAVEDGVDMVLWLVANPDGSWYRRLTDRKERILCRYKPSVHNPVAASGGTAQTRLCFTTAESFNS